MKTLHGMVDYLTQTQFLLERGFTLMRIKQLRIRLQPITDCLLKQLSKRDDFAREILRE
jgi:hypothetical protein